MSPLTEPTKLTLKKESVAATDTNIREVSLLLHGDGTNGSTTITDSSLNPKTVTAVGDAQISTAVADPFGNNTGVIAFDGTGDYLSLSSSGNINFGTDLFTVEAWIYQTQNVSTYAPIFASNGSNNSGISFLVHNSRALAIYFSGFRVSLTSATYSLNQWNHVAYVREPNSVLKIYLNGSVAGTGTIQGAVPVFSDVRVGSNPSLASEIYNGYISNLRITKGVARYTSNFTPPTAPFPDF